MSSKIPSKDSLRNLKQYRHLSDEEFDDVWKQLVLGIAPSVEFERRIESKLAEFEEDYDLSGMKVNDRYVLRALIQAIISLEDYEQFLFKLRADDGISQGSLDLTTKITKIMSDLRSDISKLQNDLKITKKIREEDQENSVISFIDGLKQKARKFYRSRMGYIVCPKCNRLIATAWFLYPEANNKISLTCKSKDENGKPCNHRFTVTSKELMNMKGTNLKDRLPEGML